jgi:hypothetical protein
MLNKMSDHKCIDKHELVSESAHLLRGLVGTILNNAGFMIRGIEPALFLEDAKAVHAAARQLSENLTSVIEILEGLNKDSHHTALDIAKIVEETCFKVQGDNAFQAKEIRSMVSSLLPEVWADGEALCRVIEILLSNQMRTSQHDIVYIHAHIEQSDIVVTIGGAALQTADVIEVPSKYRKRELGLDLLLCCALLELNQGVLWATQTQESRSSEGEINLCFSIPIAK